MGRSVSILSSEMSGGPGDDRIPTELILLLKVVLETI